MKRFVKWLRWILGMRKAAIHEEDTNMKVYSLHDVPVTLRRVSPKTCDTKTSRFSTNENGQ
jgi:hypothetical protein